ncbi:hypothetical protein [Candidatus Poriferisocius sp.]|uniref:hypothetical protein n=1 Tax=Candidatus Poriferisocius sp. TaxID=3101276 RepID=UPI003B0219F1
MFRLTGMTGIRTGSGFSKAAFQAALVVGTALAARAVFRRSRPRESPQEPAFEVAVEDALLVVAASGGDAVPRDPTTTGGGFNWKREAFEALTVVAVSASIIAAAASRNDEGGFLANFADGMGFVGLPVMALYLFVRWQGRKKDQTGRMAFLLQIAAWLVVIFVATVALTKDEVFGFLETFGSLVGLSAFFVYANRPIRWLSAALAEKAAPLWQKPLASEEFGA